MHIKHRIAEEEYFHRLDAQLIQRMQRRAAVEDDRLRFAEASQLEDVTILEHLRTVGFDHRTVILLPLVPLIQVAWADGSVSSAERDLIVRAARARGIEVGGCADLQLSQWLDERPSDTVFQAAMRALRALLEQSQQDRTEADTRSFLQSCSEVAAASGGLFGLISPVSAAEKTLLDDLAQQLKIDN